MSYLFCCIIFSKFVKLIRFHDPINKWREQWGSGNLTEHRTCGASHYSIKYTARLTGGKLMRGSCFGRNDDATHISNSIL